MTIPEISELATAINRLADAISGKQPTTAPAAAPLLPPNPVVTEKRGRGRPPAVKTDNDPPGVNGAEVPDYDSILTECRQMSVRLLDIDMKNKNREFRDRTIALWKEIDPASEGKLSGIAQEKLPVALERLKEIMPS